MEFFVVVVLNNINIVRDKFLAEAKLIFFEQFLWRAMH